MIKEVVVRYERKENECYLLDPRDNGGIRGFDQDIVNSVGGMNV